MNDLRLALRTIRNYRLYTVVNIVGLALSLACTIILSRYIYREITVEEYNSNIDRIYAIVRENQGGNGGKRIGYPVHYKGAGKGYKDPLNDPAVLLSTEFIPFEEDRITIGEGNVLGSVLAIDSNFFKVLDLQLTLGDRNTVMRNPNDAVITQEFADKHFPGVDPMGQVIRHTSGRELVVCGVIGKQSTKQLLNYDVMISTLLEKQWSRMSNGYVLVAPNTNVEDMNARNAEFMDLGHWDGWIRYQFKPLKDVYYSQGEYDYLSTLYNQGNMQSLKVLFVVMILVLLIGVFNFINIYTVLMLRRSREVGVKRVFGASTLSIVRTLYVENLVMILFAVTGGWALVELMSDIVSAKVGIPSDGSLTFDVLLSGAIVVLLPMLTTIYPCIKARYAKPITSLRMASVGRGSIFSRAIFMVAQYVITIFMVVASIYFVCQLNFMLSADLGFNTHNIVTAQFIDKNLSFSVFEEYDRKFEKKMKSIQTIRERLDASPLIEKWCFGELPINLSGGSTKFTYNGKTAALENLYVSPKWIDIFGIKMISGDNFSDSTSRSEHYELLASSAAINLLGVTESYDVMIQPENRLFWSSQGDMSQNPPYLIRGVFADFRTNHLSGGALPLFMIYSGDGNLTYEDPIIAKLAEGREAEALEYLRQLHQEIVGGSEFEYSFVEDKVREMYVDDRRVSTIYSIFAAVAILISSLGLFSLSLYDVQQRYREIALRRVNGARVSEIVGMLLRKYYILLGIAFVIAIPLSWIGIDWYMADYATRAPLWWWIYALAGLITASISLLTLIYQTLKAARTNPAIAMKSE